MPSYPKLNPAVSNGQTMVLHRPSSPDIVRTFDPQPFPFGAGGSNLVLTWPNMGGVGVVSCTILSEDTLFDGKQCLFVNGLITLQDGYYGVIPPALGAGPWIAIP